MVKPGQILRGVLLALMLLANNAKAQQTVTPGDSLALVALYNATNGADWTSKTNWLTGPVNTWEGLGVVEGRITEIWRSDKNLVGTIPPEMGALTKLHTLDISGNKLTGSIPGELGNMADIQMLSLYNNKLTGSIPVALFNLRKLRDLYIGANELTGTIPPEIGNVTTLQLLYLNNCSLTGLIPKELGNLTNLRILYLQVNNLTGTIPAELGELTNLTQLFLSNNKLTGEIPKELGQLTMLENLYLMSNTLSGSIPVELTALSNLKTLVLVGNNLSGDIPVGLGSMPALTDLDIRFNRFEGAVPTELGNISYLQIANNNFSELPDFSNAPIETLRAENNQFTFEDIEPNLAKLKYTEFYAPQQQVEGGGWFSKSTGDEISFNIEVGGSANQYQWLKDGAEIEGATSNEYKIASITSEDAGVYYLRATSALVPDLTLYSQSITLQVTVTSKQNQSISFSELPDRTIGDAPFILDATTTSELPVVFSTSSFKVTIANNQVSLFEAGSVTITAAQPGNDDFLPAESVDRTFCINPPKPVITFNNDSEAPALSSSLAEGNHWYLNDELIEGENTSTLSISEAGTYSVRGKVDNCEGQHSEDFVLVVTSSEVSHAESVRVFPNPANETVTITIPHGTALRLLTVDGEEKLLRKESGNETTINIESWPAGVYVVQAVADGVAVTKRFVKL